MIINIQRVNRRVGNMIRIGITLLSQWLPGRFRERKFQIQPSSKLTGRIIEVSSGLIDCLQNFMQVLRMEGGFTVRRHANFVVCVTWIP